MRELLFICTGNTCRSPMAEALYRAMGHECSSAGLWALEGEPMSPNAMEVLARRGIDGSGHRARRFDSRMLQNGALAVCMTQGHLDALLSICPGAEARTLAEHDISDPYGEGLGSYDKSCGDIAAALEALAAEMEREVRQV